MRIRRLWRIATIALTASGCTAATSPEVGTDIPPGPDTTVPFPIDRGEEGAQTPGTYKGLPLRLVDTGAPAVTPVDGVIGVVCIGMSNANQECDAFQTLVQTEWADEVDPGVRVVNCARGGHAIERWIDPEFDEALWGRCVDQRIGEAGVRLDQVRVLYHKAANQFTTGSDGTVLPSYPDPSSDFAAFRTNLAGFAARVPAWFPEAVAVYTSSRSYGGFARNPGRGEPLSYEEGHALNSWLADHASVNGVWYGWGPYLWAPSCEDGGVNGSGVCYGRDDYVDDGVHPSAAGREKIAGLIHDRFMGEAWYAR